MKHIKAALIVLATISFFAALAGIAGGIVGVILYKTLSSGQATVLPFIAFGASFLQFIPAIVMICLVAQWIELGSEEFLKELGYK